MAKKTPEEKKQRRGGRRSSKVPTEIIGAAALLGAKQNQVLQMMPHGFDSYEAGKGKGVMSNKRFLISAGVTLYLMTRKNPKWNRWAPLSAFITGAVANQHRVTYGDDDAFEETDLDFELYKDEVAEQGKDYTAKLKKSELEGT